MKTIKADTLGGTFEVHVHENRHPRPLSQYIALSARGVDLSDVDYSDWDLDDEPRLFIYRGSVYDAFEFESAPDWIRALGYDAWQPESAFSAVVISWFDRDGDTLDDQVIVGYIHW